MKRSIAALLLLAAASAAGLGAAELLCRWPIAREQIARTTGRGELLALVQGVGIYDSDLTTGNLVGAIVAANLRRESANEVISFEAIEREIELLRYQLSTPAVFDSELKASGLTSDSFRHLVAAHLKERQWIEKQIGSELAVAEQETAAFFASHAEQFASPERIRVAHLFLAAPAATVAHRSLAARVATPPEVTEAKREAINALSKRLGRGEDFAQLVAEASEDDATKARGGDLGFFSAARMPADFFAAVQQLRTGKPSMPIQLTLGFHIFHLLDSRPARHMPLEEVSGEIALHLTNEKRAAAVERLRQRLGAAEFIQTRQ